MSALLAGRRLLWFAMGLVLLTIALAMMELAGEGTAGEDTTWTRIQEERVLTVGIDISFPPFGLVENNSAQGIDAAIGHELGQEFEVAVRYVPVNFDGMYDTLMTGGVDILIAAVRPEPARSAVFRYTSPYFDGGYVLLGYGDVPSEFGDIPQDVSVAVPFASTGAGLAQSALQTHDANFQLLESLSVDDVISAVGKGEADYAVLDSISAYGAQQQYPELMIATERLSRDPYVIAVRRSDWKLHHEIELALYQWRRDGTLDEILTDWLAP